MVSLGQYLVFKISHFLLKLLERNILKSINISTSAAVFAWLPACWLRVAGDDAATFLQGQFTNDLRNLHGVGAVYGLWLTVKGKVIADSFILSNPTRSEFWIGSYFSPANVIRERIESHVIADDVTIEDLTSSVAAVTVLDSARDSTTGDMASDAPFVFSGRRDKTPSTEIVYLTGAGEPEWVRVAVGSARAIDQEEITRRRIAAGIPAVPQDLGPHDLPNEGGLEADAISYTKGCYLGQEVMARLKSMGRVRRRLLRVRGGGESFPALPAKIFVGGRNVGELRSAVCDRTGGWIGLAMVSLMYVVAGAELSFAPDAPSAITLIDTP